ncbi:cytochrome P450 [Georgenia sp. Z1344]|uniref:cytochrome P450 n=1 Tax=Georgenia sp. Z1344 TaxID=3416706 RepID=UPI003CEAD1D9
MTGLVTLGRRDTARAVTGVLLPLLVRGIIVRRPRATALVDRLDADRRAADVLAALRERYGPGPVRLRLPLREIALPLDVGDVERLLGDVDTFTPANREKVASLSHFQPAGLLVSDAARRRLRRPFNEAVLDHGADLHRLHETCVRAADEEMGALTGPDLTWDRLRASFGRVARRVTLGDLARDDTRVTTVLDQLRARANWACLVPRSTARMRELAASLRGYVLTADPNSLAGLVAAAPAARGTASTGQLPHWLFAFDAAAIAIHRALALLAIHPEAQERVRAEDPADHRGLRPAARSTVLESLRLWPTTLAILRDSTTPTTWRDREAATGTGFVVVSTFFHRDPRRRGWADRFTPEAWTDGRAEADRGLVPFSAGPARCPGRTLVLDVTSEVLAALVRRYDVGLADPADLSADAPLPRTLAPGRVRLTLTPRVGVGHAQEKETSHARP